MLRKRIIKNLRFFAVVIIGLIVGSLVGGVYYLNQTGFNDQWREKIAAELENFGITADFEQLSYEPTRGLVAKRVRIYSDQNRHEVIASLEHLIIDVDKTKLMRGKIRVNNISLSEAEVSLPIDPENPQGPRILVNELRGDLFMPDKRTIEAHQVYGIIGGIEVTLNANVWSELLRQQKMAVPGLQKKEVTPAKVIAQILKELSHWSWPSDKPPKLELYLEGNVDNPDSAQIDFQFSAEELEREGLILHAIQIKGDYNNKLVTLDHFSLSDGSGEVSGRADFRPSTRSGRFKATSRVHLQMLSRKIIGKQHLPQLTLLTPPKIECVGQLQLDQDFKPTFQLTGKLAVDDFSYLGTPFRHLETDISIQQNNAYFTDIIATHSEGEIKGRLLIKDGVTRFQANSTLPAEAYRPFILSEKVQKIFSLAEFNKSSRVRVISEGVINPASTSQWQSFGHANLTNFTYKGVPLKSIEGHYKMNALNFTYSDIHATFDYRNYPLKTQYGGPNSARVNAEKISIDNKTKLLTIDNIKTTAWPAPVVRLFVPHVADHIEQYHFTRPPSLSASGVFDLNPKHPRTDFKINVSAPGTTHYQFLGEELTVQRLKSFVRILPNKVDVKNLSFRTFQGPCYADISVVTTGAKKTHYQGSIHWSRIHLKGLGELYKFKNMDKGLLTGRIEFNGQGKYIKKFNGQGSLGLERANLFSIPMLGPLTPLIGTVLGKKNPTNEQAENASCTFVIQDGVVHSNNFLANTRSLRFTGEGNINLDTKKIDLLVRMNARGVFSIFALPLKPFMGLFQFSGSGAISSPTWKTSIFTSPKDGKKNPIFKQPSKARVINE